MTLQIKLEDGAKPPIRGSEFAAGYDLYSNEEKTIFSGERILVSTGIRMKIPSGYYGRIAPRSGWAVKKSVDIGAGIVDEDYTGILYALLINNGKEDLIIPKHERIAQIILEKITTPPIEIVEELEATERGDGGFGSTGTK
jgi:dUTP pyrophosphatase